MDDLLDAFARLDARLAALERRVVALERIPNHRITSRQGMVELTTPASMRSAPGVAVAAQAALAKEELELQPTGGLFSVLGKAMLGIAGAYVLRAVAESGSFPKLAVVVLALIYAGTWLVWAARAQAGVRFASTAYATTAALILAPMLGELTLRFGVLTAPATAALLSAFVVAAAALAWSRNSAPVIWVAAVAGVLTAITLLIASRELVPYTTALLIVASVGEFAAVRNRWIPLRFLAAAAADMAVLILLYIFSLPESSRSGYTPVSTTALLVIPSLLFAIYGVGVSGRTILLRQRINVFEIAQAVVAFVLGSASWLWFGPGSSRLGLGIFCWLLGASCYGAAFLYFDRDHEQRNYHVYATWAVALVLTGGFLVLPPFSLALGLSMASILAILGGVRLRRLTPEFHGLVYLAAAALVSGLLEYGARALAGTFPAAPGWVVWMVSIAALLDYAIGGHFAGERWNHRLLRLLAAVLAVSAAATFLVSGLVWLAAIGMTPSASYVSVIRTLITCTLALALAFSGSRWERIELVWTAYGTLALVAVKLLFQDLPQGQSSSIALSIFLYAAALIIVPRVARPAAKKALTVARNT
jgi:hypothetical protein